MAMLDVRSTRRGPTRSAIAPVRGADNADEKVSSTALQIAEQLEKAGYDVLLDDRDERAGVKFKDADLSGIPFRVNVGKKVSEGKVELVQRSTRTSLDATIGDITGEFAKLLPPRA